MSAAPAVPTVLRPATASPSATARFKFLFTVPIMKTVLTLRGHQACELSGILLLGPPQPALEHWSKELFPFDRTDWHSSQRGSEFQRAVGTDSAPKERMEASEVSFSDAA